MSRYKSPDQRTNERMVILALTSVASLFIVCITVYNVIAVLAGEL